MAGVECSVCASGCRLWGWLWFTGRVTGGQVKESRKHFTLITYGPFCTQASISYTSSPYSRVRSILTSDDTDVDVTWVGLLLVHADGGIQARVPWDRGWGAVPRSRLVPGRATGNPSSTAREWVVSPGVPWPPSCCGSWSTAVEVLWAPGPPSITSTRHESCPRNKYPFTGLCMADLVY